MSNYIPVNQMKYRIETKIQRILYVHPYNSSGGPYHSLLALLRKLDLTQYKPVVLFQDGVMQPDYLQTLGIDTLCHPSIRTIPRLLSPVIQFSFWFSFVQYIGSLAQLYLRLGIDLVHINSEACWIAGIAAHRASIPAISHIRGLSVLRPEWVGKMASCVLNRYNRALIAVSDQVRSAYITAGIPPGKITTVHNGLDLNRYNPDQVKPCLKMEFGMSVDQPLIGMIANVDPRKGHHDFVSMCSLVKSKFPAAKFVVVGGILPGHERYMEEIKLLASQKRLIDDIKFIGYREDIPEIIQSLDIIVQPSHTEAGPRVPLEAMAMRKPLVVTDIEGNAEEVIHGDTGFTVPVGDASAMAAAVNKLLSDTHLRQRMGHAGRMRVERFFTDDHHAKAIQGVYDEILHSRQAQNNITL
jgi:glycosyltransferase involved in cell wall biosynthesis